MHKSIEKLVAGGLTEKEASVYYAALTLGPSSILQLARESGEKRATVYAVVDQLIAQGLMRIDETGLKRKFVAEDPQYLQRIIDERAIEIGAVIPDLQFLYKKQGSENSITTYTGLPALENISSRLMEEARSGDYRYFIGGDTGWKNVDPKVQERYFKWRARIQLDVRLLFQDSERAQEHNVLSGALRHEVRTLPRGMQLHADIIITPTLLVLLKLKEPVSAVVIEDVDIIHTYKELFLFCWQASE